MYKLLLYGVHDGDAGLLQGSRSSMVRASTAKVGGLGFDSQWLPKFFPSVCFYSDLPPVVYQQFLLPVVVIRIITKIVMNKLLLFCMVSTCADKLCEGVAV